MEKEDYLVTNRNTDAMTFISLCPKEANPQTNPMELRVSPKLETPKQESLEPRVVFLQAF